MASDQTPTSRIRIGKPTGSGSSTQLMSATMRARVQSHDCGRKAMVYVQTYSFQSFLERECDPVIFGTVNPGRISPCGQLRALPEEKAIASTSTACERDHIPKQAPKEQRSLVIHCGQLGILPYLLLNSSFACCFQYILMFPICLVISPYWSIVVACISNLHG